MKSHSSSKIVLYWILLSISHVGITQEWESYVEPYLMFANIKGSSSIGQASNAELDVDFDTILEKLESGFMIHMETFNQNDWGIIFDLTTVTLADDLSSTQNGIIEANIKQDVVEIFVAKRIRRFTGLAELYGGIRYWDNSLEVKAVTAESPGLVTADIQKSWTDPVIGARYSSSAARAWQLKIWADIGGIGRGSDLTWGTGFKALYRLTENSYLTLGVKATGVDFEDGSPSTGKHFVYDTITHGPLIGYALTF